MVLRCGLMLGRSFVANITTLNHAPMASWHTWCQPQALVTLGHAWCPPQALVTLGHSGQEKSPDTAGPLRL